MLIAFLLTATAFSLFQVPYIALPAELTPGYDERTRLLTLAGRGADVRDPAVRRRRPGAARRDGRPDHRVPRDGHRRGRRHRDRDAGRHDGRAATRDRHRRAPHDRRAWPPPRACRSASTTRPASARCGAAQPFRALLSTFVLQALATGLMLAGAQYVATWVHALRGRRARCCSSRSSRPPCSPLPGGAGSSRRIGKERTFAIASVIFALAALSIVGALWAPGDWIYAPVAVAGIAYAGHAVAADGDAARRDLARRAHRGSGSGRHVQRRVDRGRDDRLRARRDHAHGGPRRHRATSRRTAVESVTQPDAAITGIVISFSVVPAVLIGAQPADARPLPPASRRHRRSGLKPRRTRRWNSVPRRKLGTPPEGERSGTPSATSPLTATAVEGRALPRRACRESDMLDARDRRSRGRRTRWSHLTLGQRARLLERLHAHDGRQRRGVGGHCAASRRGSSPAIRSAARSG